MLPQAHGAKLGMPYLKLSVPSYSAKPFLHPSHRKGAINVLDHSQQQSFLPQSFRYLAFRNENQIFYYLYRAIKMPYKQI